MTSRFGKTYSRKGGEGMSKFDEVLSTKRGTLSTKWGDTTYKAKVGSKRIGAPKNDSVLEVYKRPRPSGDGLEDPFGFDSDEESKPVSSRSGSKSSPAKPASAEPPQAERPGISLDTGSRSSLQGGSHALASARGASLLVNDRNQPSVMEDTARFFNSSASIAKPQQSSLLAENRHSYSWYQNASESDKQPLAQTTTLKSTYDSWDTIMGLRPPSPSQEPRNPAPTLSWATVGVTVDSYDLGRVRHEKPPSPPQLQSPSDSEDLGGDSDFLVETSGYSQTSSSSSLIRNSNCRTYRRPNKQGSGKSSDSSGSANAVFGADLPKSTSDGSNKTSGGRGRGRTRDYTVLHPSSVSMCNVTIQDRGVEEFSTDAAPSSGSSSSGSGSTTELGDAGWQRKKTEQPITRVSQTKSKKDSKLELFGFDDADAHQEDGGDNTDGQSNYKIKYFGFDDMSDSAEEDDDDDDDGGSKERRAKKTAVNKATPLVTVEDTPTAEPPDPFERLESPMSQTRPTAKENKKNSQRQESRIRADVLDFSEEGLRVVARAPRPPQGKLAEKNPDSFRRIFSAHKKRANGPSLPALRLG